jgi:Protein of unknown function (DUF1553)/Protein of unknown function (DUF1549)/Carbohydrate binding module (family 6)/Planctomycete cytochrome C
MKTLHLVVLLSVAGALGSGWFYWQKANQISYNEQIRPIFNKKCITCHGGVKKSGGFSLLFREEALAVAKSGKLAIVPYDADDSELVRRIESNDPDHRMPEDGPPLDPAEIKLIKKWIDQGAKWEEHWAYIAPQKPAVPSVGADWAKNEIDRFVYEKLLENDLQPSAEADKVALLRKLSLDLTGLPPTPQEVQAFVADKTANAFEKQIDRLLQSPHFGERWAAMWLDLARYADSKGYEKDLDRSIWKYRDWVIDAFNADMPFNEFTVQQLAGDLQPKLTESKLIATAFHRNTMANDEGGTNDEEFRTLSLLDRVSTTWEVWQGTTMACVQCHSHPYDPIRHEDFYKSMAFFNNTQDRDLYNEKPLLKTFDKQNQARVEELIQYISKNLKPEHPGPTGQFLSQKRESLLQNLGYRRMEGENFDSTSRHIELWDNQTTIMQTTEGAYVVYEDVDMSRINKVTYRYSSGSPNAFIEIRLGSADGPLVSRVETKPSEPVNDRWYAWKKFTTSSGAVTPTKGIHDIFVVFRKGKEFRTDLLHLDWIDLHEEQPLKNTYPLAVQDSLQALYDIKPITTPIMLERPAHRRRQNFVFARGNWLLKERKIGTGVPAVLANQNLQNRHDLAQWLVSKQNPLTARVVVNRFWEQIFGVGIVETLEDFGTIGAKPSHPELLDWLAVTFRDEDHWQVKKLLKRMVLSATYRQLAEVSKEARAKDPYNRWLGRSHRLRLSSEMIRDQALAASQLLNATMYGPSVRPPNPTDQGWRNEKPENLNRRAIYTYLRRTNPYPSFITFDSPQRNICTSRRIRTNTPLQALTTLNDTVYYAAAQQLTKLVANPKKSPALQIEAMYEQLLFKKPSAQKRRLLEELYLEGRKKYVFKKAKNPEQEALVLVANAILNLDEVLTK